MAIMNKEDLKELWDGSDALCNWFASQETSPRLASTIMANVIASMMVDMTTDTDKLSNLYDQFGEMLHSMVKTKLRAEEEKRTRGSLKR